MNWIGLSIMLFTTTLAHVFFDFKEGSNWLLLRKGYGLMVMAAGSFMLLRTFGYSVQSREDLAFFSLTLILFSLGAGIYYPGRVK